MKPGTNGDCVMAGSLELPQLDIRVFAGPGEDPLKASGMALRLRRELLELDVATVQVASDLTPVEGSKGVGGICTALAVAIGKASLTSIAAKIKDWVARTGHMVEITLDGDTIKVVGPTAEQQDQLINTWLARHVSQI